MTPDINDGADDQDQSELFDEDTTELSDEGRIDLSRRTAEEAADVLDVTAAAGDNDDDEALIGEELDDADIIALSVDEDSGDFEDDDLAGRMPEAFRLATDEASGNPVFADRAQRERAAPADQVDLVFGGDLDGASEDDRDAAAGLEADTLTDDDLEDLGYAADEDDKSAAGRPGEPDRLEIALEGHYWRLTRNGKTIRDYGHADRAVHEAMAMAEELRHTGEPAAVYMRAKDGKVIEITPDAGTPLDDDAEPETKEAERSAVVPDRSPNA